MLQYWYRNKYGDQQIRIKNLEINLYYYYYLMFDKGGVVFGYNC